MPYTATTYTTGGTATAANLTHGETQYSEATQSFQPNLFTPFVYSGLVATKDGTVLSQLDVTSGTAYVKQTDGTLRQRVLTSSTQTTSVASTTYYLDLNPDGTWSWGTAHSATANYLPIASVTTDASANIATVTDARGLNTTLLTGMSGSMTMPHNLTLGGGLTAGGAISGTTGTFTGAVTLAGIANGASNLALPNSGYIAPNGEIHANSYWGPLYGEWHGGSGQQPLSVYDDGASIHLRVGPSAGSVGRDIILETWNSGGYWAEAAAWTQTQRGIINVYDYPYPRNINVYESTTDPSTYTTPNEGDIWMDG